MMRGESSGQGEAWLRCGMNCGRNNYADFRIVDPLPPWRLGGVIAIVRCSIKRKFLPGVDGDRGKIYCGV